MISTRRPSSSPQVEVISGASPPPKRSKRTALVLLAIGVIVLGSLAVLAAGRGYKTKILVALGLKDAPVIVPGKVLGVRPADDAVEVRLDSVATVYCELFGTQIDPKTVTPQTVSLRRTVDGQPVQGKLTMASNGRRIIFTPDAPLAPSTNYTFTMTDQVKDLRGVALVPFSSSFTTGGIADPSIKFEQVPLANTKTTPSGATCLVIGPDNKLYVGQDDGTIRRYPINADGTLGEPEVFTSLQQKWGGNRLIIGFCFDPASTPENPILWTTHGFYAFEGSPDWSGALTRISGQDLSVVEDIVINLPRSYKDHVTMQPSIGPDGCIYFQQGSNSNFGDADEIWGNRPERLLAATVLRVDPTKLKAGETIDARTRDGGGTYDPFATDAPLTIYAYGVRLAYDHVWHTNGSMYMPANGGSVGGHTPAGNGVPSVRDVAVSEHDWLHRIEKGKYYGHPNPHHNKYVLNGGNPTAGPDVAEVAQYPVGVKPEPDWVPAVFDFGNHVSPNGIIEYKGNAFDGKLKNRLLVCRYNNGNDLIALTLDDKGNVDSAAVGITGFTGFTNPLDLVEDQRNGNIYVSEYGKQQITLLRPIRE